MKKIALLLLILLTSCGTLKKVDHQSDKYTSNNYIPKDFEDAEKWFDAMHNRKSN